MTAKEALAIENAIWAAAQAIVGSRPAPSVPEQVAVARLAQDLQRRIRDELRPAMNATC